MSFRTLPAISSYEEALSRFNNTEPIRGRSPMLVPLGERRYADTYSISKEGDGSVLLCYAERYPVIRFAPDNRITLYSFNGVWTNTSRHYIYYVLRKFLTGISMRNGCLVLGTTNDKIVVTSGGDFDGKFILDPRFRSMRHDSAPVLMTLRLNRAATNIVRARYGEFYTYLKGMLNLRREEDYVWEEDYVSISAGEFREAVKPAFRYSDGGTKLTVSVPVGGDYTKLTRKPPLECLQTPMHMASNYPYAQWAQAMENFIQLITPNEDAQVQADNFARALVILAFEVRVEPYVDVCYINEVSRVPIKWIKSMADELVFKWHSDEVIEQVVVKPGVVPSDKYKTWVTRDVGVLPR